MRLSSNDQDPEAFAAYQRVMAERGIPYVYLDGVLQPKCSLADDEKGEIVRCVVDAEGRAQVDPNNPEEIWVETVRGKVEIMFGEDA